MFDHDKKHHQSVSVEKYETTITVEQQDIVESGKTEQEVYDSLLKCGEYKSIRIENGDIIVIVDTKYDDYWNKKIEQCLQK